MQVLLSVVSGGIVGFTLGLLGGGGSILAVPLLLYVVGIHDAHIVIGSTAFAVAMNAYFNLIAHWRANHVHWRAAIGFAIPGVIGAYVGSQLGKLAPDKELLFLFAILMLVIAVLMLRPRRKTDAADDRTISVKWIRLISTGLLVGAISGFFGIGGGFLIVPGLMFGGGLSMITAIGSSLLSVGTFGLTTAVNYAISGLIDWKVVIMFMAGGATGGIFGTWLAARLSKQHKTLNYIFAGIIIVVASYMLYVNIRAFM